MSCSEVERKSTDLTKIVDEIMRAQRPDPPTEEKAEEASVADVGKTGRGTARQCSQTDGEMGMKRVNEMSGTG